MGSGTRAVLVLAGGLLFTVAIGMATQYNLLALALGGFGSVLFALREGFTGMDTKALSWDKGPARWLWLVAGIGLILLTMTPVLGAYSATIAPASSGGGGGSTPPPSTAVTCANPCNIIIKNSQFGSGSQLQNGNGYIVIKAGTTVTWSNQDDTQHTTTSAASTPIWDSGILRPGQSFSFTFNTPGTYPYICNVHPMTGTVVVVS
jgi:hypothetical protein